MVLGATEGLTALAVGRGAAVDVFGDRGGADEADRLNARVVQQRIDGFLVAIDDIHDAGRQTGLHQQLGDEQRGGRVALGGLEDEGIAAGDRHRVHPQRHHGREVERRDAGNHAQRLEFTPGIDARAGIAAVLALEQFRGAAGIFDILDAALQFAQRIVTDLAVLLTDQAGDLVGMFFQQLLEAEHHSGALDRRRVAPLREGGLGGRDGFLDRRLAGQAHLTADFAGGGIEDVLGTAFAVIDVAVDEVSERLHWVGLPEMTCEMNGDE